MLKIIRPTIGQDSCRNNFTFLFVPRTPGFRDNVSSLQTKTKLLTTVLRAIFQTEHPLRIWFMGLDVFTNVITR